jgi:hypothetical protein
MKKFKFILVIVLFPVVIHAQRKSDLGFIAGTDFFISDINPNSFHLTPRYAFGPIFRYSFNDRYSLRVHGIYAQIAGNEDPDRNITKRPSPVNSTASFINLAAQVEYNFFDYKTGQKPWLWTPYIFGGLGYSVMFASQITPSGVSPNNHLTIPFGVGGKVNITRRLSAGMECSLNKCFSDRIDGVVSPLPDSEKVMYGNDWYSFAGLFITYKFFKFADDCPVYD